MKTKIIFFILLSSFAFLGKAQETGSYLDTLKITINNKLSINITTFNPIKSKDAILEDLSNFQAEMLKIKTEIPQYPNYIIEYNPGKTIIIREGNNKKIFRIIDSKVELFNLTNDCRISGKNYKMLINFSDVNDLMEIDIKTKVQQVFDKLPQKIKNARTRNYIIKDTSIIHLENLDFKNGDKDVLVLTAGMGAGFIRNEVSSNITGTIGVILPKNGISTYNYYCSIRGFLTPVSYNKNKIDFNNFLYLGFKINTSKNINKQNWWGFEVGKLIKYDGSFFIDNGTFSIGTVKDFGKLSITTELFFSNYITTSLYTSSNNSCIYPGVRINFDL
jgi:hypothetical protein